MKPIKKEFLPIIKLLEKIEVTKVSISKLRDQLRNQYETLEQFLSDLDDADECLENGIGSIRSAVEAISQTV